MTRHLACCDPSAEIFRFLSVAAPSTVSRVVFTWIPGHCGIPVNEEADQLAKLSLTLPYVPILSECPLVLTCRYERYEHLRNPHLLVVNQPAFSHLRFRWRYDLAASRQCETTLTLLRCRVPRLNAYLSRVNLLSSPSCSHCATPESLEHFLLECAFYSSYRERYLTRSCRNVGLPLTVANILSFGAASTGYFMLPLLENLHRYIIATRRLAC